MEASSPIAALQPKTFSPSFGMGPYARSKGGHSFVPKLGLNKPIRDKPQFDLEALIDSSSPTTDLAADISHNFHIDKTPKIPTPRRSLFASFTFEKEEKLQIPMPSSPSPAPVDEVDEVDDMDYLPLPHKAITNINTPDSPMISPTTELPEDQMLCSSPPPVVPTPVAPLKAPEAPKKPSFLERKKSTSLSRQPFRTKSGNIFKERSTLTLGSRSKTSSLELEALFACGSPQPAKEKKLGPAFCPSPSPGIPKLTFNENSPIVPIPKLTFTGSSRNSIDGSPVAPLQRRAGPTARPKLKIRRTMSMYDNIEKGASTGCITPAPKLAPIADSAANRSPGEQHSLPCHNVKDDPLRRIKKSVLADVLDNKYRDHYDEHIVVDCRFDYEYEGGHVEGAININTTEALEKKFFAEPRTGKTLVIFHCEFSACRAPRMAMHFRNLDRRNNMHRYPALSYPDVYILEGGYSGFFSEFKSRCEPQEYVEMDHASHRQVRERELGKFRRSAKLGRSQTYHFGTQKADLSGSPSGIIGKRSMSYNSKDDAKTSSRSRLFESRRLASC